MSKTSTNLFIFAVGAAIGSAVAWLYAKKYYERIADEEIESMKEWVNRRVAEHEKVTSDTNVPEEKSMPSMKPDLMEYVKKVTDLGYIDYSRTHDDPKEDAKEEVEEDVDDDIYVIKPNEFGECDYDEVSLTYYADGILTDEQDEPIEDLRGTVGEDYMTHFGEFENDSVFIRNERLQIDFEILADQRNYSDLAKNNPNPMEDE